MNDFRTTYRNAVSDIEKEHIDVTSVLDEKRRKQFKAHRKRQKFVTMAAAGGIFILFTFGTVQASEYIKTVIKVDEYGFWSADVLTMSRAQGMAKEKGEEELRFESSETEAKEYTSMADFREQEDEVLVLPDMERLGYAVDSERIWVNGSFLSVQLTCGEKYIFFDRICHSDAGGRHATSTVYTGGVCNERTFTTRQGYAYILVDSKEMPEDGQRMIYAAISVGHYELYADFIGFEEEEVKQILEETDLSLYEPGIK